MKNFELLKLSERGKKLITHKNLNKLIKIGTFIGLTLESAREKLKNEDYRIVKIDGRNMMITDDFNSDRYNLEIENNIVINCYGG